MLEITAIELQKKVKVGKLFDSALRFLSPRPRSEFEIRRYLRRTFKVQTLKVKSETNAPNIELESVIDAVVSKLKRLKYVDDGAFVSWWIDQRIRFKPRGKFLLKSELFAKGVDRDLIEAELAKYFLEDEVSWAQKVVEKKRSSYVSLAPCERREKLLAHLARRGFSWAVIERALAEH